MGKPNLWYAVFIDHRGKQYPVDDMQRTVYFDFDRPNTPTELAREALGKRYPEIAGRARMVELAAWGLSPKCRRTAHDSAI